MEDPGTRYRYSESPTVLGRLVEIWSGRPFDEFLNNGQSRVGVPVCWNSYVNDLSHVCL